MKRTIILLALLACMSASEALKASDPVVSRSSVTAEEWQKAKNNTWPGVVSEKTYWYKFDGSGTLKISADGKTWETDSDGMWADKEGNFMKLDGRQLVSSLDGGNSWSNVLEWQAADLKWYKLDKERAVWVKK